MSRRALRLGVLGLAVTACILFVPAVLAQGSGAGLTNSPHDFSTSGWNDTDEMCRVCHVPHDHNRDIGLVGLLWNHALSTQTYTLYSSASLDGATSQPTGLAKMCLSCHDGTVGIDSFDSEHNNGSTFFIDDFNDEYKIPNLPGSPNDLSATHPISIVYDETADPGLNPKTSAMGGSGTIADVLDGDLVQCSSCHDVHDGVGEAVDGTHLLRVAQTTADGASPSALCLTCHNK
ncbi:MAG: cytochrome C [Acidobacteriota bacterium]|nr:cytochrome C [Acidobacteriota bacterium]